MQAKKGAAKKPESEAQLQLGERVRRLREQRGWSQEGFAHEGGLGRSFAGAIERGEKDIRLSTLTKLARALGVSLSQLLKGIDSWNQRMIHGAAYINFWVIKVSRPCQLSRWIRCTISNTLISLLAAIRRLQTEQWDSMTPGLATSNRRTNGSSDNGGIQVNLPWFSVNA
jgi:DNA-binding XRE family transcriptional regulator